jgi:hypothetical protein
MDLLAQAMAVVAARMQQHEHEQREELERQIVLVSILSGECRISKEVVLAAMELVDYNMIGDPRTESQYAA